jgi:hypothetical protein
MKDELEKVLEEAVVAYFKALSRHSPGKTAENHEKLRIFDVPAEI